MSTSGAVDFAAILMLPDAFKLTLGVCFYSFLLAAVFSAFSCLLRGGSKQPLLLLIALLHIALHHQ